MKRKECVDTGSDSTHDQRERKRYMPTEHGMQVTRRRRGLLFFPGTIRFLPLSLAGAEMGG